MASFSSIIRLLTLFISFTQTCSQSCAAQGCGAFNHTTGTLVNGPALLRPLGEGCQCDPRCFEWGDCCDDFVGTCDWETLNAENGGNCEDDLDAVWACIDYNDATCHDLMLAKIPCDYTFPDVTNFDANKDNRKRGCYVFDLCALTCGRCLLSSVAPTLSPSLILPSSAPTTKSPSQAPIPRYPSQSPSSFPSHMPLPTVSTTTTSSAPTSSPQYAEDVIFLLDFSASMSEDDFEVMKDFAARLTRETLPDNGRVACLGFGEYPVTFFDFNMTYDDWGSPSPIPNDADREWFANEIIEKARYYEGSTNLGRAISAIVNGDPTYFIEPVIDDESLCCRNTLLIIITDGYVFFSITSKPNRTTHSFPTCAAPSLVLKYGGS